MTHVAINDISRLHQLLLLSRLGLRQGKLQKPRPTPSLSMYMPISGLRLKHRVAGGLGIRETKFVVWTYKFLCSLAAEERGGTEVCSFVNHVDDYTTTKKYGVDLHSMIE